MLKQGFKKGYSPWNKGKKQGYAAWNKGKKMPISFGDRISRMNKISGTRPPAPVIGRKLSDETKNKIRERHLGKPKLGIRGANHPHWKGGITGWQNQIRHTIEYKLWHTAVFQRDNYTCVWCGDRNGNGHRVTLNADHIKPFAYFPELRFAIDNGRTLCEDCHKKTPTYCKKLKK